MDADLTPRLGIEFENLEEAWEFWNNYGGRIGFGTRKHNFSKSRKDGSITIYRYVCCKEGVRKPDKRDYKTNHPRPETRTGCKAKMIVSRVNGKYRISEFVGEHNHPLHPPESVHLLASQRKITETQGYELEVAKDAGLQPRASFDLMCKHVGGRANVGYTIQDARNYLTSRRQRGMVYGEAGCLFKYFQKKLTDNPSFYHAHQMDSEEQITNVFWADAQMLIDYAYFGDVVSLDTTYCTNREHRPLAIFSGFNHYRGAIIFGAALLYDETIESFKWLFETFLQAHKHKFPQTIFTDQDQAMARAIQDVMPEVKHGLCTWHIRRNGFKHLSNLMKDGTHFLTEFNKCMYDYVNETEFEDAWRKLILKYNVEENSWISSIYKLREKWAACFMKHYLTIGMRSTQLSESVNSALKSCTTPKLHISEFFNQFEEVVDKKRYNELQRDFEMREKMPRLVIQSAPMLQQVSQIYTHRVFELFQREWDLSFACPIKEKDETTSVYRYVLKMDGKKGEWIVNYDTTDMSINCSCRKFEQCGILCCHILHIYILLDIRELPEKYIMKRWTREARCGIVHDVQGSEIQVDPRMETSIRFKQLCPMLIRLATEASKCPEAFTIVQQGVLQLNKTVSELLGMCIPPEGEKSTETPIECNAQGIGFKKKEGKQTKKRMKSWVDELSQRKRRKVKSPQQHKGKSSIEPRKKPTRVKSTITLEEKANQIPQDICCSKPQIPKTTKVPETMTSTNGSQSANQITFTSLLMATLDSTMPSFEALDSIQPFSTGDQIHSNDYIIAPQFSTAMPNTGESTSIPNLSQFSTAISSSSQFNTAISSSSQFSTAILSSSRFNSTINPSKLDPD